MPSSLKEKVAAAGRAAVDRVGGLFSSTPTASDWRKFASDLDHDRVDAVRSFLAALNLPVKLADVLCQVRLLAEQCQRTIDIGTGTVTDLEVLRAELAMLRRFHPTSTEECSKRAARLVEVEKTERATEARRVAAVAAESDLGSLKNVFAELGTGEPGRKACGSLPAAIANALSSAGFDSRRLYTWPWVEAYRLQEDQPRRRIVAAGR